MLAVDFQNTNQDNSHVLYSDSWGKKNYIDYQPITPSFQIFRILIRIIFYLLCKMEGAYRKLIYPITGFFL